MSKHLMFLHLSLTTFIISVFSYLIQTKLLIPAPLLSHSFRSNEGHRIGNNYVVLWFSAVIGQHFVRSCGFYLFNISLIYPIIFHLYYLFLIIDYNHLLHRWLGYFLSEIFDSWIICVQYISHSSVSVIFLKWVSYIPSLFKIFQWPPHWYLSQERFV